YHRKDHGLRLPWVKTHDELLLREGETSVWAGVNGHGKSTLVSFVAGHLAACGTRVCVASVESRTPPWMMRLNRQIAGNERPTEAFCRHITRHLAGRLWAFDVDGKAKAERILEVFRYARQRYQVELFVLDNLTKCGFADDDYAGQKAFIEALSDFARSSQSHVAVVAHMRKGDSEDHPAGKFSVKGSGGITDMADTVIEVWRNKPRERALRKAQEDARALGVTDWQGMVPEKYVRAADTLLLVHKQRANGIEHTYGLWYDPATTQYLSKPDHRPRPLLPRDALLPKEIENDAG